jgi:hypothetical protein
MIGDRIEGGWASSIVQLIRKAGYNAGLTLNTATVTQVDPEIKIKDSRYGLEFEHDDLAINEDLLPMTEPVTIDGVSRTIEYPMQLKVGDTVLYAFNEDDPFGRVYVLNKLKLL